MSCLVVDNEESRRRDADVGPSVFLVWVTTEGFVDDS